MLKKNFGWNVPLHELVIIQPPDLRINKTVVGFHEHWYTACLILFHGPESTILLLAHLFNLHCGILTSLCGLRLSHM
jgi:hypothetical protein